MNPFRALVEALTPDASTHADRTRAAGASLKALRDDAKSLRREMGALTARADALSRQLAQLRAVRQGEDDAPARLDQLARVLRVDPTSVHVRAAVARAAQVDHPTPQLEIAGLWPADVYQAMIAAIPDWMFFERTSSGAQVLRVPPRLAPVADIAAWTAAAEIVEQSLVPAVAERFGRADAPLHVEPGRLLRHAAGAEIPALSTRAGQWFVIVIDMSGANTAVVTRGPSNVRDGCVYEVWCRVNEAG